MKLNNLSEIQDYGDSAPNSVEKPVFKSTGLDSPIMSNYKSYKVKDTNEISESLKSYLGKKESNNNYKATNKNSSATGKYQFLWGLHGKKIQEITGVKSQQEFLNRPDAQESFMDNYWQLQLQKEASSLKKYSNMSDNQLQALVHFKGLGGAKKYLTTGKDDTRKNNISIESYLPKFKMGGKLPKYKLGMSDFSGIGSSLGEIIENTQNEENPSKAGSFASGALKFGSMGLATGNPFIAGGAALIGGTIGLIQAQKEKEKLRKKNLGKLAMFRQNVANDSLSRYQEFQNQNSLNTYAKGGNTQPMYEAEDKEVIIGDNVEGNAEQIASNIHQVQGKTHDEYNPNSVNGTGEDFVGGDFIYSHSLSPDGKKSFADIATQIGKRKGKNEIKQAKYKGTDYIYKNTHKANIDKSNAELEELAQIQEVMKTQQGVTNQMKFGGLLRFAKGGDIAKQIKEYEDEIQAEQIKIGNGSGSGDTLNELVRAKNKLDIEFSKLPKTKTTVNNPNWSYAINQRIAKDREARKKSNYNFLNGSPLAGSSQLLKKGAIELAKLTQLHGGKDNKVHFLPYNDGSGTFQRKGMSNSRFMYDKNKKQFLRIDIPAKSEKTQSVVDNTDRPDIRENKTTTKTKFPLTTRKKAVVDTLPPDRTEDSRLAASRKILTPKGVPTFKSNFTSKIPDINVKGTTLPALRDVGGNRNFDKVNLGQAGIFANYLANRTGINKFRTDVPVNLQQNPDYMYRDNSGLARQNVKSVYNSINNSPYATEATKQSAYSRTLDALNQVQDQENNRKFGYNQQYNQSRFNTNQLNNNLINDANRLEIQNQNQKAGLQLENNNNLQQNLNTYQAEQNNLKYNSTAIDRISQQLGDRAGMSIEEVKKL